MLYTKVWVEGRDEPTFYQKYWSWRVTPKVAHEYAKMMWLEDED